MASWIVQRYDESPIATIIGYDFVAVKMGGLELASPELTNTVIEQAKVLAEKVWTRHQQKTK